MNIKLDNEIIKMQESGKIAASIMRKLIQFTKPGIKTIDIENLASSLLEDYKVKGAFKNYQKYPYNTCISINDEVVHGLPGNKIIKNKDIISIDFGVIYKGYYSDMATTINLSNSDEDVQRLVKITQLSLNNAIKLIKPGEKLGNIQHSIENTVLSENLGLIRDLTGHGIGKNLQEDPIIPNYAKPDTGIILKPGMVFCLEPMVTLGNPKLYIDLDGWTIKTCDHSYAAHFEHTILVTHTGCKILTI